MSHHIYWLILTHVLSPIVLPTQSHNKLFVLGKSHFVKQLHLTACLKTALTPNSVKLHSPVVSYHYFPEKYNEIRYSHEKLCI